MPSVRCQKCDKTFHAKPSWVARGFGKFCSSACQYEARKNGKHVFCHTCGRMVYRPVKQLRGSKSGKYFCNRSCQTQWRNRLFKGPKHKNWKGGKYVEYREILIKHGVKQLCRLCRCKDRRLLCVHHIDKNRKNNKKENLVWLCYNCHHLVHVHHISV